MQRSSSWIISSFVIKVCGCSGLQVSQPVVVCIKCRHFGEISHISLEYAFMTGKKKKKNTPIIINLFWKWLAQMVFGDIHLDLATESLYELILTSKAGGASISMDDYHWLNLNLQPPLHQWMHNSKRVSLTPTHLVSCSL